MLPLLQLPDDGEEIIIKILEQTIPDPRKRNREFGEYVIKCCIYGNVTNSKMLSKEYYLQLRPFILKEILKECRNNNIVADKDLKCSIGKVFTISGSRSTNAPRRMWRMGETTHKLEPPMIHRLKLIKDEDL